MITSDIPAIPQFLMRETDHRVLQAMAADEADEQATDLPSPDDEAAPSTAMDLSTVDLLSVETPDAVAEEIASRLEHVSVAPAPSSAGGYSIEDLALFRTLTGYRLDTRTAVWRAVDVDGNRVSTTDRLFTTLTEEAFRFADRQRRLDGQTHRDLTIDDLVLTLPSIRRAANSIGTRGMIAFERLEKTAMDFKEKTRAEALVGMTGMAAVLSETLAPS